MVVAVFLGSALVNTFRYIVAVSWKLVPENALPLYPFGGAADGASVPSKGSTPNRWQLTHRGHVTPAPAVFLSCLPPLSPPVKAAWGI